MQSTFAGIPTLHPPCLRPRRLAWFGWHQCLSWLLSQQKRKAAVESRRPPNRGRVGAGPGPDPREIQRFSSSHLGRWFWLGLVLLCACGRAKPRAEERPDVLFLVIDTLRADHLGCYGYPRPTSPNLDQLAARGVLFERVSSQSSWTLPSMSSLLAGRYLTAHRTRPDPSHPLLAESFQAAGYTTIGIVANTLLREQDGFGRGFDRYRECEKGKISFEEILKWLEQPLAEALVPSPDGRRAPLFLYVHAFDPHTPYLAHPQYDAELPPREALPFAAGGWHQRMLMERGPATQPEDPEWKKALLELRRRRGLYDQEIRYADEHFAKLLERLQSFGVAEKLVIAVVSDHGEGLWEQVSRMEEERLREAMPDTFFFGGHGQDLSRQALFTPLLLAGPGIPQGRRIQAPVENIDVFPTLLHLADLPVPAGLHGKDLLPLLDQNSSQWRQYSFSFVIHSACVVDENRRQKLVAGTQALAVAGNESLDVESLGLELYDLERDPEERENRAALEPERALELLGVLAAWVQAHPTERNSGGEVDAEFKHNLHELGYADSLIETEEHDELRKE